MLGVDRYWFESNLVSFLELVCPVIDVGIKWCMYTALGSGLLFFN